MHRGFLFPEPASSLMQQPLMKEQHAPVVLISGNAFGGYVVWHTSLSSSTSSALRTSYARESTTASLAKRLMSSSSRVVESVEFRLTIQAESVDSSVVRLLKFRSPLR